MLRHTPPPALVSHVLCCDILLHRRWCHTSGVATYSSTGVGVTRLVLRHTPPPALVSHVLCCDILLHRRWCHTSCVATYSSTGVGVTRLVLRHTPPPVWAVFRAKDYLPKLTVVYFLRVRRGTSQHQMRETNAGGGGVRRHTRRVKPTPEEEEYVTTKDTGGGGVCCHHSKLISYPHVFFPPKFSYFLYQSFNFLYFTFLCCDDIEYILDTNCVLHTKLYVINIISTLKKKTELTFLSLGD